MTLKLPSWTRYQALTHGEMHAVVNRTVSPTGMQKVAGNYLAVAAQQKKIVLCRSQNMGNVTGGTSAAIYIWPVFFRTGENTTAIDVDVGVTTTPFVSASPPELNVLVKRFSDGVTVSSTTEHRLNYDAESGSAAVAASAVSHKTLHITGLAADTEYVIENQVTNGLCVVYMTVREAPTQHSDDSVAGVCNPDQFVVGHPIYDAHIADLVDANNKLVRHNRCHLLSHACDYEAQSGGAGIASISGSTSYVDVFTRSITLATEFHNRRRVTTVPVVMAVCAGRTSGTGTLSVRLHDGTNSIEVTGMGAGSSSGIRAAWTRVSGLTMPAGLGTNWKIQAKQSNTTTTHLLFGVSLYEYET